MNPWKKRWPPQEASEFRQTVGDLRYIADSTRGDIHTAVSKLAETTQWSLVSSDTTPPSTHPLGPAAAVAAGTAIAGTSAGRREASTVEKDS